MLYFIIALLVIATVFLLLGLLGRGLEGGAGSFTIKVEGKVGRIPRVVFLVFSAVNYVAALVLFLAVMGAGANGRSSDNAAHQVASSGPPQVTIDISDQLSGNEYQESATVNIDGGPSVTLRADPSNPNPDEMVRLPEGRHLYQVAVQGVTTSETAYDFAGQGTILAEQGNSYSVVLDAHTGVVALQPS